jgi:Cys-tRNA(Pro)/Cys-tRNA(Cys) deacylase
LRRKGDAGHRSNKGNRGEMGHRGNRGGKSDAAAKTNAMRALDARKVWYETVTYDPAIHSATEAAVAYGAAPDEVYKTLVLLRDTGRPLLVMVPGPSEVDMRRLARSLGEKRVRMAPQRDAERLTGLQVGGIGALALLGAPFDVCLERAALTHERIYVNPGRRGVNVRIRVDDLVRLTNARIVNAVDSTDEADAAAAAEGMSTPKTEN